MHQAIPGDKLFPGRPRSIFLTSHVDPNARRSTMKVEGEAMKYMLLIYMEANAMNEVEREHCFVESTQLAQDLHASGHYLAANPLHPTTVAASVRVRDGKTLVTDGPFAETREQLGGYFLIDAKDRDEAVRIATRIPGAKVGTVEVRPVLEIPNLPE
jgi:hypothetical protein